MKGTNQSAKPQRNYQDTLFRMLFSEAENAIELFNALEDTSYGPDTPVQFTTLEDAVYAGLKNDLGFILNNKFLVLTESQSTINNNMSLRQLEYIARTYEKLIPASGLYGKKSIKIPTPEFFIVYTGKERWDASQLRLSDSFLTQAPENSMELVVKIIKMKYNKGDDHEADKVLERSEKLRGYSTLLEYIRQYRDDGLDLKGAIDSAIQRCIREGVLKDFLEKNSPEVGSVLFKDITSEEFAELRAKEAAEDAAKEAAKEFYEKGIAEGIAEGIKKLIATYREFSLPKEDAVKKLRQQYPMSREAALRYLDDYPD